MNRLQTALGDIGKLLNQKGFEWALVGGLAVSVRAEPRFTRDVDLAVAVENDRQAERLAADLVALASLATAAHFETGRALVHLIEGRKYNRGRDLSAALERLASS